MKEKSSFNWFYLVVFAVLAITIYPLLNLDPPQSINENGFFALLKENKVEKVWYIQIHQEQMCFLPKKPELLS
jgi:hypothetical protein